jgi:hypothetical protein
MKRTIMVIGLAFVFGFAIAGRQEAAQQSTQTTAPKVTVGAALKAKANNPVPGPTAKQQSKKTSIGKGKVAVTAWPPPFGPNRSMLTIMVLRRP